MLRDENNECLFWMQTESSRMISQKQNSWIGLPNVQVCDATEVESGTSAKYIIPVWYNSGQKFSYQPAADSFAASWNLQ